MALLVTAADVKAIYETDRDDVAVQPFLDAADALASAQLTGKGLTNATLKQVQCYLAAHFLFVTDTGVHEALRVEDVSERFTDNWRRPGLLDSRWGRMAVALDSSGTLAGMTRMEPPARLRVISPVA